MKNFLLIICSMLLLMSFISVKEEYFPTPHYPIADQNSPIVTLGRELFHDPILSKDSTISCASCHSQYNAFAHSDHALSHGIADRIGIRNAPALINLAWSESFMWDGASFSLEAQVLTPLTAHHEMDNSLDTILNRLNKHRKYSYLVQQAFGETPILTKHLLKAIASYESTLISRNSRYDSMRMHLVEFNEQERKGYALFKQHCNRCHTEPLFTNGQFANTALPMDTSLNDMGRYRITQDSAHIRHFKIPTLRNLLYSFPYMHDGRFKRLRDVLKHYAEGINMHDEHRSIEKPITLSSHDITDLMSFLHALTDRTFIFNPHFSMRNAK
ncbi:MAG: cytochrome-c peroxidase [Ignavibacteria bacterium]